MTTLYTLTPTHCGTGQAAGAIDLPIARESHTGLPILPATTLKGVARWHTHLDEEIAEDLFGPDIEDENAPAPTPSASGGDRGSGRKPKSLWAGKLTFTEGQLLLFPVRSLNRPFLHVTSPLLLERCARSLRAFGLEGRVPRALEAVIHESRRLKGAALAADPATAGGGLVLEDLYYEQQAVHAPEIVSTLATAVAALVPGDAWLQASIREGLVVAPDEDIQDLTRRTTPVQARVRLTSRKTTDTTPEGEKGNLWYEETLPADTLFTSFIVERPTRARDSRKKGGPEDPAREPPLTKLSGGWSKTPVQIGGNETVGQGYVWWRLV